MATTNRYEPAGKWWKGNLHMHSTYSDGARTYEELLQSYSHEYGYHFLAMTDHDHLSTASALSTPDFLFLDGLEFHGDDFGEGFHGVAIDIEEQLPTEMSYPDKLSAYADQGAILMAAHPFWLNNTPQVFIKQTRYTCIEVYNGLADGICGKGLSLVHWDYALRHGVQVWGTAVDDAHLSPSYPWPNTGWTCVLADTLEPSAILAAIRAGHFYASSGPEIKSIALEGSSLKVTCSPAWRLRLVDIPTNRCEKAYADDLGVESVAEAEFDVSAYVSGENTGNVRLEVESSDHRYAWSNPVFEL